MMLKFVSPGKVAQLQRERILASVNFVDPVIEVSYEKLFIYWPHYTTGDKQSS